MLFNQMENHVELPSGGLYILLPISFAANLSLKPFHTLIAGLDADLQELWVAGAELAAYLQRLFAAASGSPIMVSTR